LANKKQLIQNTETPVVVGNQDTAILEASPFKIISENLKSIRNLKGVMGYIIRNGASAAIDLQEPEKLVEYAIFTSQVVDSSQELAKLFSVGDISTVLVEGENLKVLTMIIKENKINIFMKKSVDHVKIAEKISL
jgi:predicted regulator of Ras-like GTPase activity (Roadblock/LC7/MglB family)